MGNQSTGHQVHLSFIYIIFSIAIAYRNVMSADIPESRQRIQMALESVTTEMLTNVKETQYKLDICHAKCDTRTQPKQHDYVRFPILSFFSYLC
jgi:hypothetical protein